MILRFGFKIKNQNAHLYSSFFTSTCFVAQCVRPSAVAVRVFGAKNAAHSLHATCFHMSLIEWTHSLRLKASSIRIQRTERGPLAWNQSHKARLLIRTLQHATVPVRVRWHTYIIKSSDHVSQSRCYLIICSLTILTFSQPSGGSRVRILPTPLPATFLANFASNSTTNHNARR